MEAIGELKTGGGEMAIRDYEQCGCQIGCGKYTTKRYPVKFLNFFNNPKGALFFLSLVSLVHGFVAVGLLNVVITTLERRFRISSSETGLILSSFDIAICVCLLYVTYVGGRGHKPQWLGWGSIIMGIGSIMFSLPHFFAPTYTVDSDYNCLNEDVLCGDNRVRVYRAFFIVGQILFGIGATPIFTLAITYLDENVEQVYSSVYHGVYYGCAVIGPGIGYVVGGTFLATFTNPGAEVSITPLSALWVGNWWAGFLIGGGLLLLFAFPILMLPKQLPDTDKVRIGRENEIYQNDGQLKIKGDENFGRSFRDWPKCLSILLRNPTIVLISLGAAMDNGVITGVAPFGPKFIETMFSLSASQAALTFGVISVTAACLGQLVGGIVVSKFKLTVPRMLLMCIVTSILAFCCFLVYIFQCENPKIAGFTVPFNTKASVECNPSDRCGCSTPYYNPLCGSDDLTYVSYCDAMCIAGFDNTTRTFRGCFQVAPVIPPAVSNGTATIGKCAPKGCSSVALFLSFSALAAFFMFLGVQPQIQASLRSVPFYHRTFAIGIQWMFLRLLGSVPMPLIMGAILDNACAIWGKVCGECGTCVAYNERTMSLSILAVICVVKGLAVIFYVCAWKTYKPPQRTAESELETIESETNISKGISDTNSGNENPVFL